MNSQEALETISELNFYQNDDDTGRTLKEEYKEEFKTIETDLKKLAHYEKLEKKFGYNYKDMWYILTYLPTAKKKIELLEKIQQHFVIDEDENVWLKVDLNKDGYVAIPKEHIKEWLEK